LGNYFKGLLQRHRGYEICDAEYFKSLIPPPPQGVGKDYFRVQIVNQVALNKVLLEMIKETEKDLSEAMQQVKNKQLSAAQFQNRNSTASSDSPSHLEFKKTVEQDQ